MRDTIELDSKKYYIIVGLCAVIIMMNSIETFFKVKDIGMFEMWLANPKLNREIIGSSTDAMYSTYLSMCFSMFILRIITPMALAINTYFALVKLRISKLFVQIWVVLLVGLFAFSLIGESLFSVFFIISGLAYLGLLIIMIGLWKELDRRANKQVVDRVQKV